MKITSDFKFDHPSEKTQPGSYEWWYFDAADTSHEWHIVLIFYDGCPFSPRYNHKWATGDKQAFASNHPAVSISLYFKGEPVFYSMSEYEPEKASFKQLNDHNIDILIGENRLQLRKAGELYHHTIELNEKLPTGDHLEGTVVFKSQVVNNLFSEKKQSLDAGHGWNLTQPRAKVDADIHLNSTVRGKKDIKWSGAGYHDHNLGSEPMMKQFTDWYWGRFHFPNYTLIYYLMNTGSSLDYTGWILDKENKLIYTLSEGKTSTVMSNMFFLSSARTIELEKTGFARTMIQQSHVLDSGPFYYRFRSDAILHIRSGDVLEQGTGITEYIRPSRIHNRVFWPLVHMRYRYVDNPHWVQTSPKLYRWTW